MSFADDRAGSDWRGADESFVKWRPSRAKSRPLVAAAWIAASGLVIGVGLTANARVDAGASELEPGKFEVPSEIDATGTSDVAEALNAFIASVPDGSTIVFPAGARYRSEAELAFRGRARLVIQGNGARIFATQRQPAERSQIRVVNSRNLVFRGLIIDGPHPNGGLADDAYRPMFEFQHGFRLEAVRDIQLDNVTVTDVYGDFVYIGQDKDRRPSERVWIHDSTFARNGRQGIAITDASSVIIERNRFTEVRRAIFDLEPNARRWAVRDIHILDNTIGTGRLLFVASHGAGPVDDIVIEGNALPRHGLTIEVMAPEGQRRQNWIVTDNESDEPVHARAIRFIGVDGVLVSQNTQEVTGGEPAVVIWDSCGATVEDNDFGSAPIERKGEQCDAEVTRPEVPALFGRNPDGSVATTTTQPLTTTTTAPTTSSSAAATTVAPTSIALPTIAPTSAQVSVAPSATPTQTSRPGPAAAAVGLAFVTGALVGAAGFGAWARRRQTNSTGVMSNE